MSVTIDIKPLSDVVGAVVDGVDLTRPVNDATADLLRDTFYTHSILCIRGQQLAASDQIRFGDLFGPVDSGFRPAAAIRCSQIWRMPTMPWTTI